MGASKRGQKATVPANFAPELVRLRDFVSGQRETLRVEFAGRALEDVRGRRTSALHSGQLLHSRGHIACKGSSGVEHVAHFGKSATRTHFVEGRGGLTVCSWGCFVGDVDTSLRRFPRESYNPLVRPWVGSQRISQRSSRGSSQFPLGRHWP